MKGPGLVGAALIAAALSMVAVFGGLNTDHVDVDQRVYEQTIESMRTGTGYYDATRVALTAKEGTPPSQLRSVRPPLMFVVWRLLPLPAWRYLVGLVLFAACMAAACLSPPDHPWLPLAAAALAGMWMVHLAPYLYLHVELWSAPLIAFGFVALRTRPWLAALLLTVASCVRELSLLAFGIAFVVCVVQRRRPWWPWLVGGATTAIYLLAHWRAASAILDPSGHEAAFEGFVDNLKLFWFSVSPGDTALAYVLGVGQLVAAQIGAVLRAKRDPAAFAAALFVPAMVLLTIWGGRVYWQAMWVTVVAGLTPWSLWCLWRRVRGAAAVAPAARAAPP